MMLTAAFMLSQRVLVGFRSEFPVSVSQKLGLGQEQKIGFMCFDRCSVFS